MHTYNTLKHKIGPYWSLYITGITSITDLKYLLTHLLIQFIINYMITTYTNQLIQLSSFSITTTSTSPTNLITIIITISILHSTISTISYLIEPYKIAERLAINSRITEQCDSAMRQAPQTWHDTHTDLTQESALRDIFNSYNNMTFTITDTLTQTINTLTFLTILFHTTPIFTLITIAYTILLLKLRLHINTNLTAIDKQINTTYKQLELQTSIKFTNRTDIHYNPHFSSILPADNHNITLGLYNFHNVWTPRDKLSRKSQTIITITTTIYTMFSLIYMTYTIQPNIIILLLINNDRIFGFLHIIARLDEFQNYSGGKLNNIFKMLDELDPPTQHTTNTPSIQTIQIHNLHKQITPTLTLSYNSPITFNLNPNQQQLILLDGPKGCGKSATLDILAGFYTNNADGEVFDGLFINGIRSHTTPSPLIHNRTYVRQKVSTSYTRNKSNTITMSLKQLFPQATYNDIRQLLEPFDLINKMPPTLDEPIGKHEKDLSGGQIVAFVLASHIWKTIQNKIPLLLLDEPVDGIDFESVCKIFDAIINKFNGLIILVTHDNALKEWLYKKKLCTEKWEYNNNPDQDQLGFTIHTLE